MGKRYVPRHAAPGKHEAPRKVRQTTERRRTETPETRERVRSTTTRKPRKSAAKVILCIELVAIVALSALLAFFLLHRDELKGTWALDETTVYEFDGRGRGALLLPLGSYEFSYRVKDNVLLIEFANSTATDATYSYSVDSTTLTLDTNTGTVYRLEKQLDNGKGH